MGAHMTCFLSVFLTGILLFKVVMVPSSYSKTYQWELLFPASAPALGFSTYSVTRVSGRNFQVHNLQGWPRKPKTRVLVIENKVRLSWDSLPCLSDKFKVLENDLDSGSVGSGVLGLCSSVPIACSLVRRVTLRLGWFSFWSSRVNLV